ncbi:Alpha/Beta hydrolase protein [Tribonema minus]|uniref:Alpha/Beta hydrolase protein n=1 Tax=Tribonema minus TaxID=303371 RepID=A0A836C8C6_9STRA|nr:Alpha/Beta hydrolase protein [Tribonema minus]
MVHGFGGSADQWARCFESELRATHRLFAIDLLGFGHSAKPPLTYSQYTWSDCVRDFGLQIVKTPFFVAGNSIGGYTSMGTAADTPGLCQGIVLLNSAGRLLTPADLIAEKKKFGGVTVEEATLTQKLAPYSAPPNAVLSAISTVIFAGLQGRIRQTCKSLYPVRPERVDGGLADNILRDSKDPGALGIFNAGAKLPYSRSANEMLAKFGGPVLVAQGLLDPLNDAKARVKQFQEAYEAVEVVPIQGGHCPQDEMAEEVCAAIAAFTRKHTQGSQSESASTKQEVVMSNP